MNIKGIPCADNSINITYYGKKLHILFLENGISIFTDDDIKKYRKKSIIKSSQGWKNLIELEYRK